MHRASMSTSARSGVVERVFCSLSATPVRKRQRLRAGFDTERHPRTIIGADIRGQIWLITVDGRNDTISLGMDFAQLQRLSLGLGLRDVLNLDGGGSTTMVVPGKIVNHPSDRAGARKGSDSLLVFTR
jgi:exopolysaccharide biosynthesis protein